MPKILIILNPTAGKGGALRDLPLLRQQMDAAGVDYALVQTEYPGHAIELARQAAVDGVDVVAAAGGDGTVNEVLNGLVQAHLANEHSTAMGVLPMGRGNDFSYGMGVPHELAQAVTSLAAGHTRTIDIGRVVGDNFPEGRYFGNGVGAGFDAKVGFVAAELPFGGMLGYLVAAVKTIFLYDRAQQLEITADGVMVTQPALMVSIMNGKRMGGSFYMAPQGDPADGQLELLVAGKLSRRGILALMPRFMKGTQAGHPAVRISQARKIELRAVTGSIPAHADGETVCTSGKVITVELLLALLNLVVPAEV